MNKAELISDIEAKVGSGFIIDVPVLVETVSNEAGTHSFKRYYCNVTTTGKDSTDAGGIGQKRTLEFYVLDEGEAGEVAYYKDTSWTNPEDKAWTGSTLKSMYLIYSNTELKNRNLGAVLKAAFDVLNEAGSITNHDKRVLLAGKVMQDVEAYNNAFMFFVATNATVQTNGPGATTDNDLQFIVNGAWDTVAEAVGLITA